MAAGALDLPLEYVRLGLRFDRLESGFVDAYTGDPRMRAEVADEPHPRRADCGTRRGRCCGSWTPPDLPADEPNTSRPADRPGVPGPEDDRRAGRFVDEVAAYFQVDVELGDPTCTPPRTRARRPAAGRRTAGRALGAAPPSRGVPAGAAGGRRARAVPRAAGPGPRPVRPARGRDGARTRWSPTSRGPDSTTTWATSAPGSRSTRTCRTGSATCRTWSRTSPTPVTTPSTAARSAAWSSARTGPSTPIFLVNTPQCLMAEGLADLGVQAAVGDGLGTVDGRDPR